MNNGLVAGEVFETRLGWMAVAATERGIVRTSLPEPTPEIALEALADIDTQLTGTSNPAANDAMQLLIRYCEGEVVSLGGIKVDDSKWTEYTRRARNACRDIPRGETRTYAWLAEQASGSRASARAAGRAMATNPVPIIIPCHRVVGSNGHLHGFGGSVGLPLKSKLLMMEGATPRPTTNS